MCVLIFEDLLADIEDWSEAVVVASRPCRVESKVHYIHMNPMINLKDIPLLTEFG